jgi:hypothetical protein
MLTIGLVLLAFGAWGFLWGGRYWRAHRWQPWCDLVVVACLVLGFAMTLFAPKGEGGSRAVYFDPDAGVSR